MAELRAEAARRERFEVAIGGAGADQAGMEKRPARALPAAGAEAPAQLGAPYRPHVTRGTAPQNGHVAIGHAFPFLSSLDDFSSAPCCEGRPFSSNPSY